MTVRRGLILVFVGVVAVLAFLILTSGGGTNSSAIEWDAKPIESYPYPVQMFPNEAPTREGRHYASGELTAVNTTPYNTNPPTSGKHIGQLVQRGFYDERVPNEIAVHHMEHGYAVVWYNCQAAPALDAQQCNELRSQLFALVTQEATQYHVIGFADPDIPVRIALTAWQFMDKMDAYDEQRIKTFIERFNCHYDPEGGCS